MVTCRRACSCSAFLIMACARPLVSASEASAVMLWLCTIDRDVRAEEEEEEGRVDVWCGADATDGRSTMG